jgi:hypothetical protein
MSHYTVCFALDKKNHLQDFQNQRYINIFMSLREREKERERVQERERARARKRKGKGNRKGKRERKCGRLYFYTAWAKMKNPYSTFKRAV